MNSIYISSLQTSIIFSPNKYDSEEAAGPMQTASSANFTCKDSLSASEYTATVLIPFHGLTSLLSRLFHLGWQQVFFSSMYYLFNLVWQDIKFLRVIRALES